MELNRRKILDIVQINQKIRRIAFEIFEQNIDEPSIVIAGICGGGYEIAKQLSGLLSDISTMNIHCVQITLNKLNPTLNSVSVDRAFPHDLPQPVVVVDDVLNTGRTLAFGLSPFFTVPTKKIQVAVLVNRGHHQYPIAADYVGYSLSTTLNEHIQVDLTVEAAGVFLS